MTISRKELLSVASKYCSVDYSQPVPNRPPNFTPTRTRALRQIYVFDYEKISYDRNKKLKERAACRIQNINNKIVRLKTSALEKFVEDVELWKASHPTYDPDK